MVCDKVAQGSFMASCWGICIGLDHSWGPSTDHVEPLELVYLMLSSPPARFRYSVLIRIRLRVVEYAAVGSPKPLLGRFVMNFRGLAKALCISWWLWQ